MNNSENQNSCPGRPSASILSHDTLLKIKQFTPREVIQQVREISHFVQRSEYFQKSEYYKIISRQINEEDLDDYDNKDYILIIDIVKENESESKCTIKIAVYEDFNQESIYNLSLTRWRGDILLFHDFVMFINNNYNLKFNKKKYYHKNFYFY